MEMTVTSRGLSGGVEDRNPLLALTPALLHAVTGDRRTRLITYLKRWNEHATLLRYLDTWLAAQPELATLRQARAEALIALGQLAAGLSELDSIDQERAVTRERRRLRLTALIAMQAWDQAAGLVDEGTSYDLGDLLAAQGRFDEAKRAFARGAQSVQGPPTLRDIRGALACGDPVRAGALLHERLLQRGEAGPSADDLRLRIAIAGATGDDTTEAEAALGALEAAERAQILELLGLTEQVDLEIVPDVPVMEAGTAEAPPEAVRLLQEHWGFSNFRGGQAAVVAHVLAGRSVLAVLPTGAGKSLTYQLPAMLLDGATVVISPLIALMKDQLDGLPPAVRDQAVTINSTLSAGEATQRLREVREGRYKLVYVAPERLRQQAFVQALREAGIARFVVDEAHCVSLWGLSFRPDYLFIRRVLYELGNPPVLALTATATPDTRAEIIAQLGEMELVAASVFRSNLLFSVVQVPNAEAKTVALVEQCQAIDGPILVYARSRERCEQLAHLLRRKGIAAGHYHAQVEDRAAAQEAFMRGDVRVLVATVAFGMGIDKPDIRAIIHYNLPQSVEAYYQEAGRAGRDGLRSHCVLLYTSADKGQLTSWLRQDALRRDDLRDVYRALRKHARDGAVLLTSEELGRELPELDETQVRVALGMLERAELVIRHFDRVDAGARSLLLEMLPAPADTPVRIEGMLREYAVRQDARVEAMGGYATGLSCRHRALAAHFGERLAACGDACDVCRGERRSRAATAPVATRKVRQLGAEQVSQREAAHSALRTLRDLPFAVGRTGLQRILMGSVESPIGPERCPDWGRLETWTKTSTNRLIEGLLENGLLIRNDHGNYPLLELTPTGYNVLDGYEPLPDFQ